MTQSRKLLYTYLYAFSSSSISFSPLFLSPFQRVISHIDQCVIDHNDKRKREEINAGILDLGLKSIYKKAPLNSLDTHDLFIDPEGFKKMKK